MLKQLKKSLKSEKKDKAIFDIIIYGSYVKGKQNPEDIDIVVIFNKGSLRDRLNKIQEIKSKIKNSKVDIKQILLKDMFSTEFFARAGILMDGISVFNDKKFSELLGFESFTLFWYNLSNLNHTEKVKFNYILAGRNDRKGIIEEFNGIRLVNGAIKIPSERSLEFEEILKNNKIDYKKKDILEAI